MIWYSWHNNQLYSYTWLDTTTFIYNTWYNNKYTYMMILDTAISIWWYLTHQSHLLIFNKDPASFIMPLWYYWYKTLITYPLPPIYDTALWILSMNKATACPLLEDPPPMRIPGAARRTPRHYPRLWISCYYIGFFCFAICVIRYPPIRRPISREDAHRMYPRYPRVFLLCYHILPTPPPISLRTAGGITVVYLCGF